MATSLPILYTAPISSCSWRVKIAMNYKGINYKNISVDRHDPKSVANLNKLNSFGQIPVMSYNGFVFTQSLSIMEYLEDEFPSKPLLPKASVKKAKVREICELIGSGIQPFQNLAMAGHLPEGLDTKEWCHRFNKKGLVALEDILKTSSGKYCVGDDISLADCCFMPQVYSASQRFDVDLSNFPLTAKIYKALNEIESFQVESYMKTDV